MVDGCFLVHNNKGTCSTRRKNNADTFKSTILYTFLMFFDLGLQLSDFAQLPGKADALLYLQCV